MSNNVAYNRYKENSVFTASAEELTLMLYNGLIKFIMQAQNAVDKKEISKANEKIIRAQDIVLELINTLDMKYSVSKDFLAMYEYMNKRLIQANIKKDKEILFEVLEFSKQFRDTWVQAMKVAKSNKERTTSNMGVKSFNAVAVNE